MRMPSVWLIVVGFLVALLVGLASGATGATPRTTASKSAASKPKEHTLSAHWGINDYSYTYDCSNCGPNGTHAPVQRCGLRSLYVEFPNHKDATGYDIVVQDKDARVNTTYHLHGPAFDDHKDSDAPSGSHRFTGFTGGEGPPPCPTLGSEVNGRFKILKATYTTGGRSTIAGTAYNAFGAIWTGIQIQVGDQTTATDSQGHYSVQVDDGTYTVKAITKGVCVVPQNGGACRTSKSVTVKKSIAQVDFQEPNYTISGTVHKICAGASGSCKQEGVTGVQITAHSDKGVDLRATTDSKGEYSVKGAAKGTYTVTPYKQSVAEFDPQTRTTTVNKSNKTGIDFDGCDQGSKATASARAVAGTAQAQSSCKLLAVELKNVKTAGATAWTTTSGKTKIGVGGVNVGFGQPAADGNFHLLCRSGCLNIRASVTDAKTGHPVLGTTHVEVSSILLTGTKDNNSVVTPYTKNGVLCEAMQVLAAGCHGDRLTMTLDQKRDADFYYWLPGVVKQTKALVTVTASADGYQTETATRTLILKPHPVLTSKTITLGASKVHLMETFSALRLVENATTLSKLCSQLTKRVEKFAKDASDTPDGGWGFFFYKSTLSLGASITKLACAGEKILENVTIKKLNAIGDWVLYWEFAKGFGVPPTGLHGQPSLLSFVQRLVLGDNNFSDELSAALHDYYYNGAALKNIEKYGVERGDTMQLKLWEVSTRLASGLPSDGLYMTFSGTKHHLGKAYKTEPYNAYITKGYLPSCWLDPKLNQMQTLLKEPCPTSDDVGVPDTPKPK